MATVGDDSSVIASLGGSPLSTVNENCFLFPCALIHVKVAVELGPSYEVVIVGRPGAADTERLAGALRRSFQPNRVLLMRLLDGGGL